MTPLSNDDLDRFDIYGGGFDDSSDDPLDTTGPLPWQWAEELIEQVPVDPPWVWEHYIAAGTKVLLAGLPKSGKTTLEVALIEAWATKAESFLGRRLLEGPVVLAVEEGVATLADKLRGLPDQRLLVLSRDSAHPKPSWAHLIADAIRQGDEIGARVIVIDSLAFWAQLDPEKEKDAGAAQQTMDALDAACAKGMAVLIVHHQNKAAGEQGTRVRGSGAFAGAVDVIVEYERLGDDTPPTYRRLVASSRWPQTPPVLVVDWDPASRGWKVVGEAEDRGKATTFALRERILAAVPYGPPGVTLTHLQEPLGKDRRVWDSDLGWLIEQAQVVRYGEGKKGNPYFHFRPLEPDSAYSASIPHDPSHAASAAPREIPPHPRRGMRNHGAAAATTADTLPLAAHAESTHAESGPRNAIYDDDPEEGT